MENEINQKEDFKKVELKGFDSWIKNPYNFALVGVLIFAFIVSMYYFNIAKDQTLWWDEAEYMSTAKHWAFDVPYDINPQRPPLLSFLAMILFRIGLTEISMRFIISVFPALLAVFITYLFIKELYDRKTALIAAFITSVSWIHLFYSLRFMTDLMGLLFGLLAFYFFWIGYIKNKGYKYIWLVGFFIGLSFLTRLAGIVSGLVIFVFVLSTEHLKFLKNKHMWMIVIIFILTISPYLIWSQLYFGNALAFKSGYGGPANQPFGWWMLQLLYDYPEFGFFIFFLIGLIALIPMILSFDSLIIKKEKEYQNDFFIFLTIITVLAFYIFFLRSAENRWLILMSIGIFTLSARGILLIINYLKKYNIGKLMIYLLLIITLLFGGYYQIIHADAIIKNKIDSYSQVKEAGLWIKVSSSPNDYIVSSSLPQLTYYSERKVEWFDNNETIFNQRIIKTKPKYIVVSIFEPAFTPQYIYDWAQRNSNLVSPVKVYFLDEQKQQPALIIYQFNESAAL